MTQEPWNEEIYESEEKSRRTRTAKGNRANAILTVLAVIFAIMVAGITIFAIYLSNGGSKTNSTEEFYNTEKSASSESSSQASATSTESETSTTSDVSATPEGETTASSSEQVPGETIIVQAGEGEASIAERAGISIADLERLNPDKMSTGTWLAHPGDVVRIK